MGVGNPEQFEGALKPSAVEKAVFEPDLFAQRITEIPSNMQSRSDYDVRTDDNPVYIGYAPKGLAEGSDGWLLQFIEYDTSDRFVSRKIAYGNWTSHATADYS
mgnify:CR=1 FL=1